MDPLGNRRDAIYHIANLADKPTSSKNEQFPIANDI